MTKNNLSFKDRLKNGLKIAGFLLLFCIIVAQCTADDEKKVEVAKTPQQIIQDKIDNQFSKWDGHHVILLRAIKKYAADPSSIEHVKTGYIKNFDKNGKFNNTITVNMTYRGSNAFGAKTFGRVSAVFDLDGNLISIKQE